MFCGIKCDIFRWGAIDQADCTCCETPRVLCAGDRQRSPGVDPKQLAAELQKVSLQQAPAAVLAALEKGGHIHSGTASATSSAVPSPCQPGSPSVNKKRHGSKVGYVGGGHPYDKMQQLSVILFLFVCVVNDFGLDSKRGPWMYGMRTLANYALTVPS